MPLALNHCIAMIQPLHQLLCPPWEPLETAAKMSGSWVPAMMPANEPAQAAPTQVIYHRDVSGENGI